MLRLLRGTKWTSSSVRIRLAPATYRLNRPLLSTPHRLLWTHHDTASNPPAVGQGNVGVWTADDTWNALRQLATSQDRAVSDVVPDAFSRFLGAN